MSRISNAFGNGKAFIAFITCGDPDLETTGAVVRAAVENGADLSLFGNIFLIIQPFVLLTLIHLRQIKKSYLYH